MAEIIIMSKEAGAVNNCNIHIIYCYIRHLKQLYCIRSNGNPVYPHSNLLACRLFSMLGSLKVSGYGALWSV